MRRVMAWCDGVVRGFVRACVLLAVSTLVPWLGFVALGIWWGAANPWSWLPLLGWACLGTFLVSRPVCRAVRALLARWTGVAVPAGYRQAGPVTRMSTGYWWNGFTYERTERDALMDQRWRNFVRDPATRRDWRFTLLAPPAVGVIAAVPPGALAAAIVGSTLQLFALASLGLVVAVATSPYAWRVLAPVATRFLRPSAAMAMADRVDELTAQRADTTVAQAAEIRRIERDLHDGAQARLVGLGLSLATAEKLMETDPEQAKSLLAEARAGAATSLAELRELVRGISPPVLSERGLVDAVRALALDSPLETEVNADAGLRLDPPVESALYFGIAELLTNAVKHAEAGSALITIARDGTGVVVEVTDDGRGGAEARPGGGLEGLQRRLAVFDGTLELASPAGGPTRAGILLPCASS